MSKQRSGLRMSVLLREEDFNVWQKEKETESRTFANDLWFIVRGKDRKTSEKLLEYWHFICENSEWKCIERKKKG